MMEINQNANGNALVRDLAVDGQYGSDKITSKNFMATRWQKQIDSWLDRQRKWFLQCSSVVTRTIRCSSFGTQAQQHLSVADTNHTMGLLDGVKETKDSQQNGQLSETMGPIILAVKSAFL